MTSQNTTFLVSQIFFVRVSPIWSVWNVSTRCPVRGWRALSYLEKDSEFCSVLLERLVYPSAWLRRRPGRRSFTLPPTKRLRVIGPRKFFRTAQNSGN